MWGSQFAAAKADYAEVARAIARNEPVLMVANPGAGAEAAAACANADVEVVEWPIDDSWTRDMGAVIVADGSHRAGVDFVVQLVGREVPAVRRGRPFRAPHVRSVGHRRASTRRRSCSKAARSRSTAPARSSRPSSACSTRTATRRLSRDEIEDELRRWLGVERIVWLPYGILEDDDTDGHVDNVAAFVGPGRVIAQTTTDRDDPEPRTPAAQRRRAEGCGSRRRRARRAAGRDRRRRSASSSRRSTRTSPTEPVVVPVLDGEPARRCARDLA